jgi:hypothetical protein
MRRGKPLATGLFDKFFQRKMTMTADSKLIKVGRQGILVRNSRIPASFFRHQQPGKRFIVLAEGDRRLMHVRAADLDTVRRAYREYAAAQQTRRRRHSKLAGR